MDDPLLIIVIVIFAVLFAFIGLILLIRNLVSASRLRKAKRLAEAGEKGKALELFLKSLRFQLGSKQAQGTLDHILALFRSSGYGDLDLQKMKDTYSQIDDEFKDDLKELDSKKLKDKQKINAINLLSKEYGERFDREFVSMLPRLD